MAEMHSPNAVAGAVRPALDLEARFDDNSRWTEHGTGDWARAITPGLGIVRTGTFSKWEVWARRTYLNYAQATASNAITDRGSFRMNYAHSDRSSANLALDGVTSTNQSETDRQGAIGLGGYRDAKGSADISLWRVESRADLHALNYRRKELVDATEERFECSVLPVRSQIQTWLVTYWGQQLAAIGRQSLTSHAALAGFRRSHTTRLSTEWEVGAAEVRENAGKAWNRRVAFAAGLTLAGEVPGDEPRVEVRVHRDAVTSVQGVLRRRLPLGPATARWESMLRSEGGYLASPLLERRAALDLDTPLSAGATISWDASYYWADPHGAPGRRKQVYRAGVAVSEPIKPWLTGRLGYDYVYVKDPNRPVPLNVRRNRISMSLAAEMP